VWKDDRVQYAAHWPKQTYLDSTGPFSNVNGPFGDWGPVTISVASPAVVNWPTLTGAYNGEPILFQTTGALPTGLTAGTTYYILNLSGTSFNVAASPTGPAINTSGTQSGTQAGEILPGSYGWFSRLNRHINEIKEVASVSGNTVTFTSPLAISYRTSRAAQLTRYTGTSVQTQGAGIESLTVLGGGLNGVMFNSAAYSWAKDIEVTQMFGDGVGIYSSFRVELRDSYIHQASWPEPGGAGYSIDLAYGSSELLIENNIVLDDDKVIVARSAGTGSVVGYNYMDDSWIYQNTGWVEVGLNASHMPGSHHVLFEGNYSHNFDSDDTHGASIYLTAFRNVLTGQRRDFTDVAPTRAVGLGSYSNYMSFVGNLLGRSGQMTGWHYTDPAMACDANGNNCTGLSNAWADQDIWKLGVDHAGHSPPMNPEQGVLATVIRDGNYDYLTNSQRWHNTPGGFAMPNSMYLTAKPAFFGSNPWPWSDPATGAMYTLPAKARYDAGNP
jgi:hypothetical protein